MLLSFLLGFAFLIWQFFKWNFSFSFYVFPVILVNLVLQLDKTTFLILILIFLSNIYVFISFQLYFNEQK